MRKKITPSFIGLMLNFYSLILALAAILLEKASRLIDFVTFASIILYFIALYHFKFEKHKARKQA